MHRLFAAVPVPLEIKERIFQELETMALFGSPKARLIPKDNWHFTVIFLGYQADNVIMDILAALEATVKKFAGPGIRIKEVRGDRQPEPRMIWATTDQESSKEIGVLKNFLEEQLIQHGVRFRREQRVYQGHITLVRFGERSFITHPIRKKINLSFRAKSLDLMESNLRPSGAQYTLLKSYKFLPQL